jgi:hypothetical protein
MSDEAGIALNRLAREQMKARLLADIAVDLKVCELEGLDPSEYVRELRQMLADIGARLDILGGTL